MQDLERWRNKMAIRREIFVTQKRLDVYIDITYGSDLIPIELVVMDYAIPAEAMAVAYVKSKTSDLKKAVCEISDNVISFTPEAGLFEIGENTMQIRVTYAEKNLFSYKCNVKCQGSFLDDDAEELDSQPTLVAQLLTEVGKVKATTQEVQQEMNEDIDLLYKNISNPNLFINGNFQIWSNGESFQVQNQSTEVVTPVLTADKWYVESVDSTEVLNVNKTNEGLFISSNTSQNCKIYQVLDEETYNAIKWKTLTLSYEYEQPYSAEDTSVYYETHKEVKEIVASEADARIFASNNAIQLPIGNVGGTGCKLHWVKLEVGSIDTLCIPDSKDAIICKLDKEVAELNSKLANGIIEIKLIQFQTGADINTEYTFPLPDGWAFWNTATLSFQIVVGSALRDALHGGVATTYYTGQYLLLDNNATSKDAFAIVCKYR